MPNKKGTRRKKPMKLELEECTQKIIGSHSSFSDHSDDKKVSELSLNSILQDDLLEHILVYLPIVSIVRAGLVCKKWRDITTSKRFLWNASQSVSQNPWFVIFFNDFDTGWYAYDPILQKWQDRDFLHMIEPFTSLDSSDGLVCFVENNEIHVYNPITEEHKKLQEPLDMKNLSAVALMTLSTSMAIMIHNLLFST
ncbi:unnamed protein product [Rhodiola kirilowii]